MKHRNRHASPPPSVPSTLEEHFDGWLNAMTGVGTEELDKLSSHTFYDEAVIQPEQCEILFKIDDLAARVAEALPEEALRQPFDISVEGPKGTEIASDIQGVLGTLKAHEQFLEAWVWARVLGGAALFMGTDAKDLSQPLVPEAVQEVRFLTYIDTRNLVPDQWYADVQSDKYGQVAVYSLHPDMPGGKAAPRRKGGKPIAQGQLIHESHMIMFPGERTSPRNKVRNSGRDFSVFQRLLATLRSVNSNWQSVAHLLTDASQSVLKIKGLRALTASKNKAALENRMRVVNMARSVARIMPIDADQEEFLRIATPFTGIPELLDKSWLRLAAASRMPVSILMGQSPAGMNATGEMDLRWWYAGVESKQHLILEPRIKQLVDVLLASANGPTKGAEVEQYGIRFRPLWGLTTKEKAEVYSIMSTGDKNYIDSEVLFPEEVALNRFPAEGYSQETQIELEDRKEILDAEMEREVEHAGEEPPVPVPGAPGQPGAPKPAPAKAPPPPAE